MGIFNLNYAIMLITELTNVVWDFVSTVSSQGMDLETLNHLLAESGEPDLPKCVVRPF